MPDRPSPIATDETTLDRIADDFQTHGFAVVEDLASPKDVAALNAAYQDLLDGRIACGEHDRQLGGITRQILMPHLYHTAFADNETLRKASRIAARLINHDSPALFFSMAIYKPPGHPHETPWHQDMAYAGQPVAPAGEILPNDTIVQFWLALDDVDENMGCMEFVPGAHERPMPEHYVASGNPEADDRLLAMVAPERDLDLSTAVACPLKAGSATVHGYATPHYTGPNRSQEKGRPAFIFSFVTPQTFAEFSQDRDDLGTLTQY